MIAESSARERSPEPRRSASGPERGRKVWPAEAVTIFDGQGGTLRLAVTPAELVALVDACRELLQGTVPAGASMLRVAASGGVYLASHRLGQDGRRELRIGSMFEPADAVRLPYDRPEQVLAILREIVTLYWSGTRASEMHVGGVQG